MLSAPWLPQKQRGLSPLSSWARSHWESTADHMLTAIRAHSSPEGAFVVTSFDQTPTTGLEGFARASLLAAYRSRGTDESAIRDPLLSWLGRGVEVGCSPDQPGSWPGTFRSPPGDHDARPLEEAQRHVLGQIPPADDIKKGGRLLPLLGDPVLPAPSGRHLA